MRSLLKYNDLIGHSEAPSGPEWQEPAAFHEALAFHMMRHGESYLFLCRAITQPGETFNRTTLRSWLAGDKAPRSVISFNVLGRIERRYGLPEGYFRSKLPNQNRAPTGIYLRGVDPSERRRLAWHLPIDFNQRSAKERREILEWVRTHIISGSTDYRRFQSEASKNRYAIRFPALAAGKIRRGPGGVISALDCLTDSSAALVAGRLQAEMEELVRFKTATFTEIGQQRNGVWGEDTAAQRIEHLGLMFGALAASPHGPVSGFGAPIDDISFGHLIFPRVWDWYVQWRERRRGFLTSWEADMLRLAASLTRRETGWIRQNADLGARLKPIPHLVSEQDIANVTANWSHACDRMHAHSLARCKEVERVAKVHRDPFEPILPILKSESPVAEYRKITEEIIRTMPDAKRYPRAAAEAVRSFLMLRLGLHLGVRQKNLRQLLFCSKGRAPKSERQLEALKRGELRWSDREQGWEVLIPAVAFKNAGSSFFAGRPLRLVLPDLGDLYRHIEDYLNCHRPLLLLQAADPGTFFVKTVKVTSQDPEYDQTTFYSAWRLTIQRYGIWNPYTQRGVVKGLLPHGPNNVRDVLATHILKQTGSYEQASYAIQDTPETVAKHYGRFLPQDKAALAAETLNKVWKAGVSSPRFLDAFDRDVFWAKPCLPCLAR